MEKKWSYIGSGVGTLGGIYYAFQNKTGFWKGLGIVIILSFAGGVAGGIVDSVQKK